MKKQSKALVRLTSIVLIAVLVTAALMTSVFAANDRLVDAVNASIVDALGIKDDERADVIVTFDSPSSLECGYAANSDAALKHEQKLRAEQNAVLAKLGITPKFSYTAIINAVAINATGREIRRLEASHTVDRLYIPKTYQVPETDNVEGYAASSAEMIDSTPALINGYSGDGVVVAVIDSGVDISHEAFSDTTYITSPVLTPERLEALGFADVAGYKNAKIPFYFDYVAQSALNYSDENGHGTHVAGIVGGYMQNPDSTVKFSGIAPGTQICAMRVMDENGSSSDAELLAALEDAYRLEVNLINLSLGRDSGFSYDDDYTLSYNGIYGHLEAAGTMVICAAGNSGGMHTDTPLGALDETYMDYGTISFPASYLENISVGSANGKSFQGNKITISGTDYQYTDPIEPGNPLCFVDAFQGETHDIVYLNAYGATADYESVDVAGKIVAVNRGELSFSEKCSNAAAAGAIGLIVINNDGESMVIMSIEDQQIPAICVEYAITEALPVSDYVVTLGTGVFPNPLAGFLSDFSAIGVTPDLQIGLDILGIGGSVYSALAGTTDGYVTMNGTSMATPCVVGSYAVIYEYLKDNGYLDDKTATESATYIDDLTQSTASILSDSYGDNYSPRQQGAGLINVADAIGAEAYIKNPIVSLGYDKTASGKISMSFELVSLTSTDKEYAVSVNAITDAFAQVTSYDYKNLVQPYVLDPTYYSYQLYVDDASVSNDASIALPAGQSITVKVELTLLPNIVNSLLSIYPNGFFLDGYVEFYDTNDLTESEMHASYVSFVGDWLAAPAIETVSETDILEWLYQMGVNPYDYLPAYLEVDPDANVSYNRVLIGEDGNYHIGQNPLFPTIYVPANPDRNAITSEMSNADIYLYDMVYILPSLLRNCESVRYVISDSDTGKVYAELVDKYVSKDAYVPGVGHLGLTGIVYEPIYDHVDALGQISTQYIPSGTTVKISIYTLLDHPDATERLEFEIELTVDYIAPEVHYDYDADTKQLRVVSTDNEYLAGLLLFDADQNIADAMIYAENTAGVKHEVVFDLSSYDSDYITIVAADYASNTTLTSISLAVGDISNVPITVNTDQVSGLAFDFENEAYLYQDLVFSATVQDGYCTTDDFAILVNGTPLTPTDVKDGVYYYTLPIDTETIEITVTGLMKHNFVPTVTKEEGCLSVGELSHICSNCSHVGSIEVIEPHGHTEGEPVTVIAPTCSSNGIATVSCTECGTILKTNILPALDHNPGDFEIEKAPTCTEKGLEVKHCTRCGEIVESREIDPLNHSPAETFGTAIEATCTEKGLELKHCTRCGEIVERRETDPLGHSPAAEFEVVTQATCTTDGLEIKRCTVCHEVLEKKVLPATGHTHDDATLEKAPTCTEAGLEITRCAECEAILSTKIVSPTGHTVGSEATAVSPAVCGTCGMSYGTANSSAIIVVSTVLSSVSFATLLSGAVLLLIKKRR